MILLVVQKSGDHQLKLVGYPIIYRVWAPSQVVSRISSINMGYVECKGYNTHEWQVFLFDVRESYCGPLRSNRYLMCICKYMHMQLYAICLDPHEFPEVNETMATLVWKDWSLCLRPLKSISKLRCNDGMWRQEPYKFQAWVSAPVSGIRCRTPVIDQNLKPLYQSAQFCLDDKLLLVL